MRVAEPEPGLFQLQGLSRRHTEKEAGKGNFYFSVEFLKNLGSKLVQLTHISVPLTMASHHMVKLYSQQANQLPRVIPSVLIT